MSCVPQYKIDRYADMPLTIPDFAFPDMQIVIYCDGFASREGDRAAFRRDRLQSRELQLRGWIVLRFAGNEINYNSEMVVDTIERADQATGMAESATTALSSTTARNASTAGVSSTIYPFATENTSITASTAVTTAGVSSTTDPCTTEDTSNAASAAEASSTAKNKGRVVWCYRPRLCRCRNTCTAGFYLLRCPLN